MVTPVSRQDRVPRMRLNRALGRSNNAGNVGEANLYLALEFSRLDMLWMAGYLGGESALSAAAKYQRIASFIVLLAAGIIHNAAAGGWNRLNSILADLD